MRKYFMGSFAESGAAQLTLRRLLVDGSLILGFLATSSWLLWK